MTTENAGLRADPSRSLKETAALIRKHLKYDLETDLLPEGKYSVTTDPKENKIRIRITQVSFQPWEPRGHYRLNQQALTLLNTLDKILDVYRAPEGQPGHFGGDARFSTSCLDHFRRNA